MIRILVADSHPLIRNALKGILERESDMRVTGDAENSQQVIACVRKSNPGILITSLSLKGEGALDMIRKVRRRYPNLSVIVLTLHPKERFAVETIKAGASGFLPKDVAPDEIIKAVRKVAGGEKYIPVSLSEKLNDPSEILSRKPRKSRR